MKPQVTYIYMHMNFQHAECDLHKNMDLLVNFFLLYLIEMQWSIHSNTIISSSHCTLIPSAFQSRKIKQNQSRFRAPRSPFLPRTPFKGKIQHGGIHDFGSVILFFSNILKVLFWNLVCFVWWIRWFKITVRAKGDVYIYKQNSTPLISSVSSLINT